MDDHEPPANSGNFYERRDELIGRAYELTRHISLWGRSLAEKEFGQEVIANIQEYLSGECEDDKRDASRSFGRIYNKVEAFCEKQIDSRLVRAYSAQTNTPRSSLSVVIGIFENNLLINQDCPTITSALIIHPQENRFRFLRADNLENERDLREAEQIVEDMEIAFWGMFSSDQQPSQAEGYEGRFLETTRRTLAALRRRLKKSP